MDKILHKVRKMMAIANDAATTEGERDNALRMAYNLLAKHNMTMVDLDAATLQAQDPRAEYTNVNRSQLWARDICHTVADLFFCKHLSGSRINADKCVHHFFGKQSNATTAMLMSEYIVQSLVKQTRKMYKNGELSPEGRSFCLGAVAKLRQRVLLLKEQQETESAPGTALVLANLYESERKENELVIADTGYKIKSSARGKGSVSSQAYVAGKEYASNISLNAQVAASRNNLKITG